MFPSNCHAIFKMCHKKEEKQKGESELDVFPSPGIERINQAQTWTFVSLVRHRPSSGWKCSISAIPVWSASHQTLCTAGRLVFEITSGFCASGKTQTHQWMESLLCQNLFGINSFSEKPQTTWSKFKNFVRNRGSYLEFLSLPELSGSKQSVAFVH